MLFEKLIRKLTIGPFCSVAGGANHSTRIVEAFSAETLERFAAPGTIGIINTFKFSICLYLTCLESKVIKSNVILGYYF